MGDLVLVCGRKMGNHASVMAGDNDAATAGGLFIVNEVLGAETSFLTGRAKDFGILVGANAAYVDNGVGREDVLLVGLGQPTNVKQ